MERNFSSYSDLFESKLFVHNLFIKLYSLAPPLKYPLAFNSHICLHLRYKLFPVLSFDPTKMERNSLARFHPIGRKNAYRLYFSVVSISREIARIVRNRNIIDIVNYRRGYRRMSFIISRFRNLRRLSSSRRIVKSLPDEPRPSIFPPRNFRKGWRGRNESEALLFRKRFQVCARRQVYCLSNSVKFPEES